jgi:hypothetical protein
MPGDLGTLERIELKHQIARDMAIIDMFGGTTPKEIGPELMAEVEANFPEHLRHTKMRNSLVDVAPVEVRVVGNQSFSVHHALPRAIRNPALAPSWRCFLCRLH